MEFGFYAAPVARPLLRCAQTRASNSRVSHLATLMRDGPGLASWPPSVPVSKRAQESTLQLRARTINSPYARASLGPEKGARSAAATASAGADGVREWLSGVYDSVDYADAIARAEAVDTAGLDFDAEEYIYGESDTAWVLKVLDAARAEREARGLAEPADDSSGGTFVEPADDSSGGTFVEPADDSSGGTFVDLGSGRGQVVLAVALSRRWRRCVGVEIMPVLHEVACAARRALHDRCRAGTAPGAGCSPCEFLRGDLRGRHLAGLGLGPGDTVFAYATKFPVDGAGHLALSRDLAAALRPGAAVVTVNRELDPAAGFTLLSEMTGPSPETNGETLNTAFMYIKA